MITIGSANFNDKLHVQSKGPPNGTRSSCSPSRLVVGARFPRMWRTGQRLTGVRVRAVSRSERDVCQKCRCWVPRCSYHHRLDAFGTNVGEMERKWVCGRSFGHGRSCAAARVVSSRPFPILPVASKMNVYMGTAQDDYHTLSFRRKAFSQSPDGDRQGGKVAGSGWREEVKSRVYGSVGEGGGSADGARVKSHGEIGMLASAWSIQTMIRSQHYAEGSSSSRVPLRILEASLSSLDSIPIPVIKPRDGYSLIKIRSLPADTSAAMTRLVS
nr:hypothetical protein CFP56_62767 [Quercus suber]